jgi:hypothetical protein
VTTDLERLQRLKNQVCDNIIAQNQLLHIINQRLKEETEAIIIEPKEISKIKSDNTTERMPKEIEDFLKAINQVK